MKQNSAHSGRDADDVGDVVDRVAHLDGQVLDSHCPALDLLRLPHVVRHSGCILTLHRDAVILAHKLQTYMIIIFLIVGNSEQDSRLKFLFRISKSEFRPAFVLEQILESLVAHFQQVYLQS